MQEDILRRIFINYLCYNKGMGVHEASVVFDSKASSIYEVTDLIGQDFVIELFNKVTIQKGK